MSHSSYLTNNNGTFKFLNLTFDFSQMTLIALLDERNIYPAYKISFMNKITATLTEDRHPITQTGIFCGGHI